MKCTQQKRQNDDQKKKLKQNTGEPTRSYHRLGSKTCEGRRALDSMFPSITKCSKHAALNFQTYKPILILLT